MTLGDADFRKSRMKVIYRKLSKTASLSVTCLSLHIDTPASTRLKSTFATRDSLNKWRFAKYCPTCLSPFRDGHHTAGPMAPPTSGHQPRRRVDMLCLVNHDTWRHRVPALGSEVVTVPCFVHRVSLGSVEPLCYRAIESRQRCQSRHP